MKALGGQGGGGGTGCFEFWLYRYQTLIAAILALVAAVITVRPALKQFAEMRKQSAQQAFQTLRTLKVQLAEEAIIIQDIDLHARYAKFFEDQYKDQMGNPGSALSYIKHFQNVLDALTRLERALLEGGARNWSSKRSSAARSRLIYTITKLRSEVFRAKTEIETVVEPFTRPYPEAEWVKAAPELLQISLREVINDVQSACSDLNEQNTIELSKLNPALDEATEKAFGFN
jgi:hypothetical protein